MKGRRRTVQWCGKMACLQLETTNRTMRKTREATRPRFVQELAADERMMADGSVVRQDGVSAARNGRQDDEDDEGSATSSFHPRSWPRVLVLSRFVKDDVDEAA
ncbi:hypothetical protein LWI29_038499 [Acer saccharum]|uniref:Uncharacterized protein n=1 Tax=Acer saccharum TaxID=4024 RepID=A0AA39TMP7_ACESA|nr:hypothetical protein LWI29_038499 [Acer saccharum]